MHFTGLDHDSTIAQVAPNSVRAGRGAEISRSPDNMNIDLALNEGIYFTVVSELRWGTWPSYQKGKFLI